LRGSAVAKNYAEALFELGQKSGRLEEYGRLIDATWSAIDETPALQSVLMSPKVPKTLKAKLVADALTQVGAPVEFGRYLAAVIRRGRQLLFGEIADAYHGLVDRSFNRVRASITVARAPDDALRRDLQAALTRMLSKEVIPSYHVDPAVLGGAIVRVGDQVYDGSLRRRLMRLRRQLISS